MYFVSVVLQVLGTLCRWYCSYLVSVMLYRHLLSVIRTVGTLNCTPASSGIEVPEGQTVKLTASLTYYGTPLPPVTWYQGNKRQSTQTETTRGYDHTTTTSVERFL